MRSGSGPAQRLGWRHLARPAWPGRGGLVSFYQLECLISGRLGNPTFADLSRPFAVVTTDMATGDPFMISQGLVAQAVRERLRAGVRGARRDRRPHAGRRGRLRQSAGGPARALGADYVIGVNIFGRHWRKSRSPLGRGLAGLENAIRWSGGGLHLADCVIEPDVADFSYIRFRYHDELIAHGEAAAEARLPQIKAALGIE